MTWVNSLYFELALDTNIADAFAVSLAVTLHA